LRSYTESLWEDVLRAFGEEAERKVKMEDAPHETTKLNI